MVATLIIYSHHLKHKMSLCEILRLFFLLIVFYLYFCSQHLNNLSNYMKKAILISLLLALFVVPSDANNVLVLNQRGEQVNSVTNDKYYVIAGYAQNGSTTNFLYDTGAGVKAT